jgi:Holliday junction DNA helicase RuvA
VSVSGIGFHVFVPTPIALRLTVGEAVALHTTLVVREDSFTLFGFDEVEQLALFDYLRSVAGVGPKTALATLSSLTPAEIANAVADEDSKPFERVSGIGAKTAKLIVVTLSGKLKALEGERADDTNDLLLAMQSLGWPERVAEPVVRDVLSRRDDRALTELIRETLSILGSK